MIRIPQIKERPIKLISWNVAGRLRRIPKQIAFLKARAPDFVALQEVRPSAEDALRRGLSSELGLPHTWSSLDSRSAVERGNHRLGIVIASRYPADGRPCDPIVCPRPEKTLSISLRIPGGGLDLFSVHVPPGSSNGWLKVEVLESIYASLARPIDRSTILCGDFNAPRAELPDGRTVTWAQRLDRDGNPVVKRSKLGRDAARWDRAERNVLRGLEAFGFSDAYRSTMGWKAPGCSWIARRNGSEFPRRFDHAFTSSEVEVEGVRYLHGAREEGLSDHSALELDFGVGSR